MEHRVGQGEGGAGRQGRAARAPSPLPTASPAPPPCRSSRHSQLRTVSALSRRAARRPRTSRGRRSPPRRTSSSGAAGLGRGRAGRGRGAAWPLRALTPPCPPLPSSNCSNDQRATVKAANPALAAKEIVSELGAEWKKLDASEKKVWRARTADVCLPTGSTPLPPLPLQKYEDMAAADKKRYEAEKKCAWRWARQEGDWRELSPPFPCHAETRLLSLSLL